MCCHTEIEALIKSPTKIVEILAKSLPGQVRPFDSHCARRRSHLWLNAYRFISIIVDVLYPYRFRINSNNDGIWSVTSYAANFCTSKTFFVSEFDRTRKANVCARFYSAIGGSFWLRTRRQSSSNNFELHHYAGLRNNCTFDCLHPRFLLSVCEYIKRPLSYHFAYINLLVILSCFVRWWYATSTSLYISIQIILTPVGKYGWTLFLFSCPVSWLLSLRVSKSLG